MDLNSILQFILSLIGQAKVANTSTNQTPSVNTISILRGPLEPSAGIFGDGSLTWDSFKFVSLENEKLFIPAGTYKLEWHESPHLGNATVPLLIGVPGRTEIFAKINAVGIENCQITIS